MKKLIFVVLLLCSLLLTSGGIAESKSIEIPELYWYLDYDSLNFPSKEEFTIECFGSINYIRNDGTGWNSHGGYAQIGGFTWASSPYCGFTLNYYASNTSPGNMGVYAYWGDSTKYNTLAEWYTQEYISENVYYAGSCFADSAIFYNYRNDQGTSVVKKATDYIHMNTAAAHPLIIGLGLGGYPDNNRTLTEVRIYNFALDREELAYNASHPGEIIYKDSLLFWAKTSIMKGDTLVDLSGHGYDGIPNTSYGGKQYYPGRYSNVQGCTK